MAAIDKGFDQPQQHAAQGRAPDVADPSQYRRHKRLQSRQNPHVRIDSRIIQRVKNPARRRQRRAESERERNHPVIVDSHQRRRHRIERHRAHRRPHFRSLHDELQSDHQQGRHAHHQQLVAGNIDRAQGKLAHGKKFRERLRVRAEDQLAHVLQKKRNADGRDQHRQLRALPQRPVSQPFDDDSEQRAKSHRQQQRQRAARYGISPDMQVHRQRQPNFGHADRERRHGVIADERPHHEHVTMGKIDKAQNSIDHGVAQRQQGINRPQRQPVDHLLEKFSQDEIGRAASPLAAASLINCNCSGRFR